VGWLAALTVLHSGFYAVAAEIVQSDALESCFALIIGIVLSPSLEICFYVWPPVVAGRWEN